MLKREQYCPNRSKSFLVLPTISRLEGGRRRIVHQSRVGADSPISRTLPSPTLLPIPRQVHLLDIMTGVFVTGASGYIGQHVAIAFRRAGYKVYGLVRSKEKGIQVRCLVTLTNKTKKGEELVRHEVIPVVGDFHKPETWLDVLPKVAWVITTVPDFEGQMASNKLILEAVAKSAQESGVLKTFIFTSGALVYAHSLEVRDENSPIVPDHPFFGILRAFEKEVLDHSHVHIPSLEGERERERKRSGKRE